VSVESNETSRPEPQSGGLDVIGSRLAAARREQRLEVSSVASRLHLSVRMVNALEAGDEAALPAMTFIRGYIKTYARLLGLDEQQVLSLLPSGDSYRPAPLKVVGIRQPRRRRPVGKWLVWLAGAAAVVVLIVYGVPMLERLWSGTHEPAEDRQNMLPLPPGGEAGVAPEPFAVAPQESEPDSSEEPYVPEPSEPDVEDVQEEMSPLPADQPAEQAGASDDSSSAVVAHSEPRTPVADTEPELATITLRFSEDSWVEMESHGRKLVVGIQAAGSERTVRASPPVQVLLGNAPGVELQYRGKVVDLKPHRRGNVARLVLED
jgi:cytoskeleton protein RodZ